MAMLAWASLKSSMVGSESVNCEQGGADTAVLPVGMHGTDK